MNSADQRGLPVMSLVRVHNFSVSLDGFSAGADQSQEAPFGHAGDRLVRWFTGTRSFHVTTGQQGGSTGIDDAFASNWGPGIGEEWKGWWGEEPPFHTPVFVLTHHVRPSIEMKGGTPSASSTPARRRRLRRPGRPQVASTSASAAARPPSASSSPPT